MKVVRKLDQQLLDLNQQLADFAWAGDIVGVKATLAAGADVNARSVGGETALLQATMGNHSDICEALIEAGANANDKDKLSETAACRAFQYGCPEALKALLRNGAKGPFMSFVMDVVRSHVGGNDFEKIVNYRADCISIMIEHGSLSERDIIPALRVINRPHIMRMANMIEVAVLAQMLRVEISPANQTRPGVHV